MTRVTAHFTRCFIAGIVALLPIGGVLLSVIWIEAAISESWLSKQAWYFPGMGIVLTAVIIYLIGLTVSSILGKWLWSIVDRMLHRLPLLGKLYGTLKQIIGYGDGANALFQQVVLVNNRAQKSAELGLVTNQWRDARGTDRVTVFVPFAATPTAGRLLLLDAADVTVLNMPVSEALKALVSVGLAPAEEMTSREQMNNDQGEMTNDQAPMTNGTSEQSLL